MNLKKTAMASLIALTLTTPVFADAFIVIGGKGYGLGQVLQLSGTVSTTVAEMNKNKSLSNTGWGLIIAGSFVNLGQNLSEEAKEEQIKLERREIERIVYNMVAEAEVAGKYPSMAVRLPIADAAGELEMDGATLETKIAKLVEITEAVASNEEVDYQEILGPFNNNHNREIISKMIFLFEAAVEK